VASVSIKRRVPKNVKLVVESWVACHHHVLAQGPVDKAHARSFYQNARRLPESHLSLALKVVQPIGSVLVAFVPTVACASPCEFRTSGRISLLGLVPFSVRIFTYTARASYVLINGARPFYL
jgi:hypothetical protein